MTQASSFPDINSITTDCLRSLQINLGLTEVSRRYSLHSFLLFSNNQFPQIPFTKDYLNVSQLPIPDAITSVPCDPSKDRLVLFLNQAAGCEPPAHR